MREDSPAYGSIQTVPAHHWFENEHPELELIETMVATEQYDYTLTLLLLPDIDGGYDDDREDELLEDTVSHFI